jgi:hypothetical protein
MAVIAFAVAAGDDMARQAAGRQAGGAMKLP